MTTTQFKQLILPLKNKLFRFAFSYLASEADAKDVVQDVMIKTWEEIEDPASIKNMEAWCIRLTRNKSLDKLKKKGRVYMQIVDQYDLHSPEMDPLTKVEEKESAGKIRTIISLLPEKQRDVITLRDIEGYSYKEVAEIMELEMSNVKVLLFRARKKIRQVLIQENDEGISYAQ